MTTKEFVMWFKGFSEACHHLNPTPQQWEKILEKLNAVKEGAKSCGFSPRVYTYPYTGTGHDGTYVTNDCGTNMTPGSNQLLND